MKKLPIKIVALAVIAFFSTTCVAKKNQEPISKLLKANAKLMPLSSKTAATTRARKDWNFIVYFTANNNLHQFAIQNIQQMMQIGSTSTMNAIIQLDELGSKKISRYYIQKGSASPEFTDSNNTSCISGTQESLYNFLAWTIQTYPANHQCVVLWNHGSGIKDPSIWGKLLLSNRDELFVLNKATGLYEINRKIMRQGNSQTSLIQKLSDGRGIGFNETFETYLTNQDLQIVLERVSKELLNGQKIDIICMDACMMEMVEVGSQIKNAAKYMVGSEEVERGEGYPYEPILTPFLNGTLTPENFAKHITQAYAAYYYQTEADYTQSAINVDFVPAIEENFAQITKILTDLISSTNSIICTNLIKEIRKNGAKTIEFNDPDYIDLGRFYTSLHQGLACARDLAKIQPTINILKEKILQGLDILQHAVIANAAGSNLSQAAGLAFYFPARTIHKSYPKTVFDKATKWTTFLEKYLKTRTTTPKTPRTREA